MHFIPLSNEQAHTWVNLLFAESFGLTRAVANTPRFPKVEIQQCDINRTAAAQNSPSFLKHLCTVIFLSILSDNLGKGVFVTWYGPSARSCFLPPLSCSWCHTQ